jgi:hypothetical protein
MISKLVKKLSWNLINSRSDVNTVKWSKLGQAFMSVSSAQYNPAII